MTSVERFFFVASKENKRICTNVRFWNHASAHSTFIFSKQKLLLGKTSTTKIPKIILPFVALCFEEKFETQEANTSRWIQGKLDFSPLFFFEPIIQMIGHVFAVRNIIANKLQRNVTKTQEDNIFLLIHIFSNIRNNSLRDYQKRLTHIKAKSMWMSKSSSFLSVSENLPQECRNCQNYHRISKGYI